MTTPRISVVVPFYNNADLLGDCLASIAAQTFADLQVVMVDDGSTDGSAAVATAQAAADPRFTLISVANGGPGSARNHGVAAATGEFLAFVDADDLLPPDAYATLLPVLERSGSDFVSGGVLRLSSDGSLGPSGLHDRAIKARRLATHISRTPELCYDISVWNKLFRRSFWDAAGLRLPEGMLWEDLVAMTMAHVLATSVDVITEPIYYWRDRDKGAPSITQSRTDIRNFRDRITALGMIDEFLRSRGTPAMLRQHQHKALVNDLWLYIRDLPRTSADYQREFIALARSYLAQVSHAVQADLPAGHKLAYYLIEHDRQAELAEFAAWLAEQPGRTPPMVRRFGRLSADLPLRQNRELAIPARVFRPQWRELDPYVQVDKISWQGGSIVVDGAAYVPSMDIRARRHTTKLVVLVPRSRRRPPVVLLARSVLRPAATAESGQDRYRYDWSGFRCVISPRWFRAGQRWLAGDWDCFVLVRGRSVWRPARLHSPGPDAEQPESRTLGPGVSFGAHWAGRRLQVRLRREQPERGGQPEPGGQPDRGTRPERGGQPEPGGQPDWGTRPVLTAQAWTEDGRLILTGRLPEPGDYRVLLRHLDGWERHLISVRADAAGGTAAVPVGAMDVFGDRLPLRDGRWMASIEPCGRDGEVIDDLVGNESAATTLAAQAQVSGPMTVDTSRRTIGRKVYRCEAGPDGDGVLVAVGPVLRFAERGRIRRRLLRDVYYRIQRLLPVREAILFISFTGKSCGDNPRGVADELRRRGDAKEQIWAVNDWTVPVPPGARSVLMGTAAYYAAIGRSSHLVVNDHMPRPYRKRAGQHYAQTWHGTPLKRIGYDIINPRSASGHGYLDFMAGDVAQWDLLLSPNPFSTPILRRAFRFTDEICETGYPRNDALLSGGSCTVSTPFSESVDRVAEIRQRLGLPAGQRVATYVPTWRDDVRDAAGRYGFDFRLDLDAARRQLGDDYVLLIRGHHLMAGGVQAAKAPGFAFDVTGYPDICDLLLVTDVLITDYSSVMFDFAPTGRPMLFFTYDLEQYRDQLRGFYFDFEAEAPGPLLATSDQVVAALSDLDSVAAEHQQAHAAFTARFCPLDDGKASARACDRIFGS
jgi:CDP-glycerol glycerophosphotransferase